MKFEIESFGNGSRIPSEYAFGKTDPVAHFTFAGNRNPRLTWSDAPPETRSFAIICVDADAPADRSDANQEGKSLPRDLPRTDFYHWVLIDIPPNVSEIPAGAASDGVTPMGKPYGASTFGRSGLNDYTGWFTGEPSMEGKYGGYDGPGPPWNDELLHRYTFTLYALDVDRLDLADPFTGETVLRAISGHVLAQADWKGTYAINPGVEG